MLFEQTFPSKSAYFLDETHSIRLAIASSPLLGFAGAQPLRKNDSFEAFEEVLKKARIGATDLLLLGGNLFSEGNPSGDVLNKAISLLKSNIFGDKAINYEAVWGKQVPNYACENMNIDLPIFAINGKKDYSDEVNSLDVLHTSNYVIFSIY